MKQIVNFFLLAGALLLLLPVALVQAEQRPLMPLAHMEEVASLDFVDFASGRIVLSGSGYTLAPDVRWHGLEPGKSAYLQRFSLPGRQVSYRFGQADGKTVITDLFVLPKE